MRKILMLGVHTHSHTHFITTSLRWRLFFSLARIKYFPLWFIVFASFHTRKNVISVSHEENGNFFFLSFQLINGGEVKKSFSYVTSLACCSRRCVLMFAEEKRISCSDKKKSFLFAWREAKVVGRRKHSTHVTFTLDRAYTWANKRMDDRSNIIQ